MLGEIMQRHGVKGSIEDFHKAVNITFHKYESEIYDQGHKDMWESLPRQFALLIQDWLDCSPDPPEHIDVLDVGCGTGLATHLLLNSPIGLRIRSIALLDTSSEMLQRASERAAQWNIPYTCHEGTIQSLDGKQGFDLIVSCSVLHHIPDLRSFLRTLCALHKRGGVFLHLQDPNGDHLRDPELTKRMAKFSRPPEALARFGPKRILGRVVRQVTGKQADDYISKANRDLIRQEVIRRPLSVEEIFKIVDIHVQDGAGVSLNSMQEWMDGYESVARRSYGFFGKLASTLPPADARTEAALIEQHSLNGFYIGATWRQRF